MDAKKVKSGSRDAIINSFSDEILAKILSFLPTKRAASTSLISRRWRYLFPLMFQLFASQHHLHFDYSDLVYPEEGKSEREDVQESFRDFVYKTLSRCNSVKKLSLKCPRSSATTETDQWLRRVLERGDVMDLDLRFPVGFTRSQVIWPTSVFTIKTLVKLTYIEIERGPHRTGFPKVFLPVLKSLFLHAVWYACDTLCYSMLPGCPILEELFVNYCSTPVYDRTIYSISHKTLKRLTLNYNNNIEHCRIMRFNTPSLIYLDFSGSAPTPCSTAKFVDSLVEAKLDVELKRQYEAYMNLCTIMSWMRNVKTLSLASASVKDMYSRCVALPFFSNLVKLHFESNTQQGWEVLRRMLNKSPKLETLILKGLRCVSSEGVCIDRNEAKVLELYGFRGSGREVRQVKCFLREMQCLQVLKVETHADDYKKLLLMNYLILGLPKRSSKLKILFL
ncbi:PREDICTED: LOW QUALITY PROTEIN: putative F-box/LRR-repeat protein At5g25860 [Camelina sativa]|uniref:LOW QUALITY PROTEIN: putative F-box/LRR-repeat protein At5g25860 n=1 Tax=Camelina sativa TaxID=90675 RepID=A0ABM1RLC0_CAMSA|nr:PREDICTED: LOW QUALITY PROTEIN: putative F-box/LRR-repeat protein At5g25860 [Camelina sativa]